MLLKICGALPVHLHALLHKQVHAMTTAVSHLLCLCIDKTVTLKINTVFMRAGLGKDHRAFMRCIIRMFFFI